MYDWPEFAATQERLYAELAAAVKVFQERHGLDVPDLVEGGSAALPPLADVDGRDVLAPRGEAPPAYVETLATHLDMGWSPLLGLRTERDKYIRAPRPELYDLAEDPYEQRNIIEKNRAYDPYTEGH